MTSKTSLEQSHQWDDHLTALNILDIDPGIWCIKYDGTISKMSFSMDISKHWISLISHWTRLEYDASGMMKRWAEVPKLQPLKHLKQIQVQESCADSEIWRCESQSHSSKDGDSAKSVVVSWQVFRIPNMLRILDVNLYTIHANRVDI